MPALLLALLRLSVCYSKQKQNKANKTKSSNLSVLNVISLVNIGFMFALFTG